MWSIQGLSNEKISSQEFVNFVSKMQIVSLVETWCDSGNPQKRYHWICICNINRRKHKKARRNSGGTSIYVNHNLCKGVTALQNNNKDIVWAKLDKMFFNLKKDIYLGIAYFSPETSLNKIDDLNERYSHLLRNIEYYSLEDILIQGDLYAYIGNIHDFILTDDTQFPKMTDPKYVCDSQLYRNNLNKKPK